MPYRANLKIEFSNEISITLCISIRSTIFNSAADVSVISLPVEGIPPRNQLQERTINQAWSIGLSPYQEDHQM